MKTPVIRLVITVLFSLFLFLLDFSFAGYCHLFTVSLWGLANTILCHANLLYYYQFVLLFGEHKNKLLQFYDNLM